MPITLNHTIVPSHDKEESAQFFARMFGLNYSGPAGHFAQVRVNGDLAFDWDNRERFESHHYAFVVSDSEVEEIFARLKAEGVTYGSGPTSPRDGENNHRRGARGTHIADLEETPVESMTYLDT